MPESKATEPEVNFGTPRLHEDAVRFVRQRLLALEEGRLDDADLLHDFILNEFGLVIQDVETATLPQSFRDSWQIPNRSTAKTVTLLVNYGREPVWRIPNATPHEVPPELKDNTALVDLPEEYLVYGPGWYETPLALHPNDPITGEPHISTDAPAHLCPRLDKSGPLPAKILKAIRPWSA